NRTPSGNPIKWARNHTTRLCSHGFGGASVKRVRPPRSIGAGNARGRSRWWRIAMKAAHRSVNHPESWSPSRRSSARLPALVLSLMSTSNSPPSTSCSRHAPGTAGTEHVATIRSNGACSGNPLDTITRDERRMKPDRGEPFPSRVDDLGVQVDAEHPLVTEPVHQQRGVVASTGADLQHLVPIVDVEGFQHPHHEIRLGATGNPLVVGASAG